MKSFCLIGDSIDQSLSPYIHSWIYNFLDIDAQYKKKDIKPKNFNIKILDLLYSIKMDLIHGVNITSPYKVNIISPDIKLSDDAKKIAVPAKSSGTPHLPAGILDVTSSASFGKFFLNPSVIFVVMYPGKIELT